VSSDGTARRRTGGAGRVTTMVELGLN